MPLNAVIIVAFGPRRVTADAVERAKTLAGPESDLVVVPATRQAQRLLGSLRSARVQVATSPGRAGLEEALERAGGATVLLLHDDVLLPASSLDAMVAVHQDEQAITTAWTNDIGQPNSIGSLPPSRHADAAATAAAMRQGRTVVLDQVRPSCLVGSAVQLRRLLHHRLSVSRTVLHLHGEPIVAAAHAVAAHDSTCVGQLAAPASPDGRPLVTAALIVRDEAQNLFDCLASLDGVVDRIVVCDTGSLDGTVELAREHGAEVFQIDWRDDFAWARNQVLERCRDSWYVLQVDADERLCCDPEEVRQLLATDVDDSVGYTVRIDNLNADDRVQTSHLAVRLFRPDGVQYVGALHEVPMRRGSPLDTTRLEAVSLTHLGYRDEFLADGGKYRRNADISRQAYEDDPTAAGALHYARSLIATGEDDDLARRLLEDAAGDLAAAPRALALTLLGHLALTEDDIQRAIDQASAALDLVPADDSAGRLHAEAALAAGRPEAVVARAAARADADSVEPYSSSTIARGHEMLAVARANVALDDLTAAAVVAADALAGGFVGDVDGWTDIVSILVLAKGANARAQVIEAAARDHTGCAIEAIARTYPAADAAAIAGEVVEAGGLTPAAVRLGVVGAIAGQDQAKLDVVVPHLGLLPLEVVERMIEAATKRGWQLGAEKLASGLLLGV